METSLEPVSEWWRGMRPQLVAVLESFNQEHLDGRCFVEDYISPTSSQDYLLAITVKPRMTTDVEGLQPEAVELKVTVAGNRLATIAIGAYCPNLPELVRDDLQRVVPWLRWYERNLKTVG